MMRPSSESTTNAFFLYDLLSGLETIYPFPRSTKVEAGATIAIWSSGEAEHKPKEGQYVMKVSLVTDPMQDLPFVEYSSVF